MNNFKPLAEIAQQLHEQMIPNVIAITLSEFLNKDLPPRVNILDPWLPSSGLAMVHAKRGIGKTFFALEIAMIVAYGDEFLSFKAPTPARVLYIDGEMPANTMQKRLSDIKSRMPVNPNMIEPVFITPDLHHRFTLDLSTSAGRESIREFTDQADLIIVDNISTLCGSGKENEADSWMPIQGWALGLRSKGKSVLFVHHSGKGGLQRGTSKREDILDTVIMLKQPSDYEPSMGACFELHFEKSRGMIGDSVNPISCRLTANGWEYSSIEENNYQLVVNLANEGLSQTDIVDQLGITKGYVSKLFNKAKAAGAITFK